MSPADTETIAAIREYSRRLVRELDVVKEGCQTSDLSLSQCHVLFELNLHKTLSLMQLSEHLLIDKSNLSRTVKTLVDQGLVKHDTVKSDARKKLFRLTPKGEKSLKGVSECANAQVVHALQAMDVNQRELVVEGLRLYSSALRKSRLQSGFTIRPIKKKDNGLIGKIIREVMTEFNAVGVGYSIEDPEVDDMFSNYRSSDSCYFVIIKDDEVVGGGGIGPLKGGKKSTCELRKMFFLPAARGIGMGRRLLELLMNEARDRNYKTCYLETLERMWQARALYEKFGFKKLEGAMGNTGHCSCDSWYSVEL